MELDTKSLSRLALTIRILSAESVEKANSGHPGMPMGMADVAAVLWSNFMRFNPKDPNWQGRDRFVLSAGHGSMLLYSMLHLFNYDLPISELKSFRQWESKTPGHPEFGFTPGVETTTGPLGQGLANGVGLALSAKMLSASYKSNLFSTRVFGIVSDGDLMEGVASEAASLAGHLKLGNIVYVYDDNDISIGGSTDVCFTENVGKRFEAYGWHVTNCDGHDFNSIGKCLDESIKENTRPSLIVARTKIGFGSPSKAGTAEIHGSPLGKDELAATKKNLGWTEQGEFVVPQDVRAFTTKRCDEMSIQYDAWNKEFSGWQKANPDLSAKLSAQLTREIPAALKTDLIAAFTPGKKDATRNLSGQAIQVIAKHLPFFVGGSADLEPSTKTLIKGAPDISASNFEGKNFRFGVREHGMGAITNGLSYTGAWIPFGSTFLVFADYMRPTLRLAALSHLQNLFIFTHDSFWVGEDGPTHEPIEQIASLRLIPNLYVFRPADGLEVAACYFKALQLKRNPSALMFTRQNVPVLERPADFNFDQILKGAYVVKAEASPEITFVATGSEVGTVIEATKLIAKRTRVVSMPCVELFNAWSSADKEALIPSASLVVSVEAGTTIGWENTLAHCPNRKHIGINHYGASAPGELLAEKFGFTAAGIVKSVMGN